MHKMLGRWIKELKESDSPAFRRNVKFTPEQQELRDLRAQVKTLEMEKEILKKASQYFAKEMK